MDGRSERRVSTGARTVSMYVLDYIDRGLGGLSEMRWIGCKTLSSGGADQRAYAMLMGNFRR